ncbi:MULTISPECIES: efflux RND transporter periplasmic adaptor subunit [Ramlibacter]|uniref:Efflux RND transporter periplasmic adaptor subunit n=1 Tax=Ramlibacter pinisoli TaxID=2682844 RepID=A0A6N8IR91_9BURK|nr:MULTISPECIES: efflux RND transporter periplasmic adaptor subunit [Ramlibacter]MBA2964402.1 efflux RND transporter periplasmic adaptor subunit [Ramlibacter sp. CGMCC 1.13660]MVQ29368.1 efflux RND transporter periplasmic adaptor subunit [Ramlibacter pinisoli]
MASLHKPVLLPLLLAITALLSACGKSDNAGAPGGGAPGGGMPPPEVGVVTVKVGDIGLVTELPGRLEASRVAQVRARAAGIVQERLFKEGSDVKAGQPLFRIDPAQLQASSASAKATLARAEANLTQAASLAERYKPLVEANAISKQDYAAAVAAQKAAEADVAASRAAVQTAQINLNYALVTSPISGRIGRALVTEGALVGQGEATPLALVQQINPMYVNVTQSSTEVLNLRRSIEQGRLKRAGAEGAQAKVLLEDGTPYPQTARLLFSDLSVDPGSGQVTLRAEVPNPQGLLLPGMYVRVQLEQAKAGNAILLPQQAVTRSGQGDSVMVVAPDGKVAPRPVKVGGAQNGSWVILDGLKPGEQVMVDGFQKLRPGAPVKPVPWNEGKPAAPAGPASAASGEKKGRRRRTSGRDGREGLAKDAKESRSQHGRRSSCAFHATFAPCAYGSAVPASSASR